MIMHGFASRAARAAELVSKSDDESEFKRTRHLAFACLGLLQAPLAVAVWDILPRVLQAELWSAQHNVLAQLIPVCFAALIAWLAFEWFNTNSDVTVLPRRWTDVGIAVILVFVVHETAVVSLLATARTDLLEEVARLHTSWFTGRHGELSVGWLVASATASATAEELVHRALLLRALEGYMNRWLALGVHALIFEVVHVYIYGYGSWTGAWFIAALIFGYAFQCTRSVAVPVILHASTLVIYYLTVWYLTQ